MATILNSDVKVTVSRVSFYKIAQEKIVNNFDWEVSKIATWFEDYVTFFKKEEEKQKWIFGSETKIFVCSVKNLMFRMYSFATRIPTSD